MPELYSIVRGKVGKTVEFGLSWGIRRLRGGFLLATLARDRHELHDSTFAVRAVDDHIALFGKAPRAYAYDRGGWSAENVKTLREKGVKQVKVNWRTGQGEVTFDSAETSELDILENPVFRRHYKASLIPSGGCC